MRQVSQCVGLIKQAFIDSLHPFWHTSGRPLLRPLYTGAIEAAMDGRSILETSNGDLNFRNGKNFQHWILSIRIYPHLATVHSTRLLSFVSTFYLFYWKVRKVRRCLQHQLFRCILNDSASLIERKKFAEAAFRFDIIHPFVGPSSWGTFPRSVMSRSEASFS